MQKQLNKLQCFNQTNEYGKLISSTLRGQKLKKLREGITVPLVFVNFEPKCRSPLWFKKVITTSFKKLEPICEAFLIA